MINYNIVPLSIQNGLNNHEIASGMNYLILLEAPSGANVTVRLNENTADKIPLKENSSIEVSNVRKLFISADAIPNGRILIGQSNTQDLKINPNPNISNLEELGDFGTAAKSILQFLPTDSMQKTINAGEHLELDITDIKALRFQCSDTVGLDIKNNGIKYPIKANEEKEIFTHFLNSNTIKIYNDTASAVTFTTLVMGNLKIDFNYVESNYVENGYML